MANHVSNEIATDFMPLGDFNPASLQDGGQIVRVNDKSIQLQIADKVRIELAKAAVAGYQGQEPVVTESGNM